MLLLVGIKPRPLINLWFQVDKYVCTRGDHRHRRTYGMFHLGLGNGQKFSQFHAVFREIWQNHMLAPPGVLALPPTGNSGSAPASNIRYICDGDASVCKELVPRAKKISKCAVNLNLRPVRRIGQNSNVCPTCCNTTFIRGFHKLDEIANIGIRGFTTSGPQTAQIFLNSMQFFGNFGNTVCLRPLEGQPPSYGESWIHPDYMKTKTSSKKILAPTVRIELVTSGILVCCSPFWANLAFLVSLILLQSYSIPNSIYMCNALAWIKILLRATKVKFMWHINDYIATPFPHNKSLHKI